MKLYIPSLIIALCAGMVALDVGIFHWLTYGHHGLAISHILSFTISACLPLVLLLLAPEKLLSAGATQISKTHTIHCLSYIFLISLVIFLRGGLLGTLTQILNVPLIAASLITSLFSVTTIFLCWWLFNTLKNASTESKGNVLCLMAVGYILLLKLFYLGVPELIFEEAYYWNYAEHLDIGYLDHPLIVAWTIKTFTLLLGNIEFAVRLGAYLYWFITAFFAYKLSKEMFNETVANRALLLVAVLPAYFSFGWFMTPDAPLTACWAAAVYYAYHAIMSEQKSAWIKLGIALGLGMSSKYTIALLGASIFLFILVDKSSRKWLLRKEPYLASLIVFALFSPVIIWNIQHNWLSFTFQSQGRIEGGHHFSTPRFISNLIITLTPTVLAIVIALVACKKSLLESTQRYTKSTINMTRSYALLACLGLFPIAVYAVLSLTRASKLNWTGPCWLALLPFLALVLTYKSSTSKWLSRCNNAWPATLIILMLFYGGAMHFLGIGLPYVRYPQNMHLMGFDGLGREIQLVTEKLEAQTGKQVLVVGMDRNKIASGLAFYRTKALGNNTQHPSSNTASEHLFGGVGLMYELWFPISKQKNKTMLLVGESKEELNSQEVLSSVSSAGPITAISLEKAGRKTGQYYYRVVEGYHQALALK